MKTEDEHRDATTGQEAFTTWTFERVANLDFTNKGGLTTKSMFPGARSMIPGCMDIVSREELLYYLITHREFDEGDTLQTRLMVHLTSIGGDLLMDFIPFTWKAKVLDGRFASNHLRAHTFAKFCFAGDTLQIHPFNTLYITALIEQKRIRLKHEILGNDDIVLKASTPELRAFIRRYLDDPQLCEEEMDELVKR